MRPNATPFLASALLVLACGEPSSPAGTEGTSSSGSTSSGLDTRGDSTTTAALDDTAASGSATGDTSTTGLDSTGGSSSSGPGESTGTTGGGPVNGCSDGEREAFEDELTYPDIAGCAGGWSVPGVEVNNPFCDRVAGDDSLNPSGIGCSVEDLCSEDWHVCRSRAEVMDAGVDDCTDVAFGGAFFATRQSGEGMDTCAATGVNDVFGCGDIGHTMIVGCAPLNRSSANGCVELPHPWSCSTSLTQEAEFLIKEGPEFGGVICCRD